MAEILGAIASGITVAGLFKTCLEAFNLIQTGRNQSVDLKKLKLRLNIEKCRLYVWGEAMGLTSDSTERRPIDAFRFPDIVQEILESLLGLFQDSHRIQDKYGCKRLEAALDSDVLLEQGENVTGPIRSLAATFSNFAVRSAQDPGSSKLVSKVIWVINDRKKFGALVVEIKYLVDSLQGITSPCIPIVKQTGTIRKRIIDITDTETLSLIAEVCSDDHPDIADAATTRADTISMVSSERRNVAAWTEHVVAHQGEPEEGRMSPDVDSMTVTELKHLVLKTRAQQKEREAYSSSNDQPTDSQLALNIADYAPLAPQALQNENTEALNDTRMDLDDSAAPATSVHTTQQSNAGNRNHGSLVGLDLPYGPIGFTPQGSTIGYLQTSLPHSGPHFTNPWAQPTGPQPHFTNPWVQPTGPHSTGPARTFADALDASRGMVSLTAADITPRNIYGTRSQGPTSIESYGYPSNHASIDSHSVISTSDNSFHYNDRAGSIGGDYTDGSSIASDAGYSLSSRTSGFMDAVMPRPNALMGTNMPPAPQSMLGQFSSKVSSASQKKHKCKICDKRFTRPSSLQVHMYSHTGEKPFMCEFEGCGRHFSIVSNLRRHKKVHRYEREGDRMGSEVDD